VKYIEVEQKFELPDPTGLRNTLQELDGTPRPGVRQVDTYYNAPHRDFLTPEVISEWLRIRRNTDGTASVNYKLWHPIDAAIKTHADEYESPVGDPEAIERTLLALGFTEMVTVDKTRQEWTIPNAPVLVAIDTLEGFGSYVEFEYKSPDAATVEDATADLDRFIADLSIKLGDRVNRGYPHLLLGRVS
jgi:adenylate cyclase class 2